MKFSQRRNILLSAFALALSAAGITPAVAQAQEWPNRPVKLVVPFPPGGTSDIVARLIAQPLGEKLKQPVLVENRPGAGTTIGAKAVITANDGAHTLFVSNSAPISIAPFLFDAQPYDPVKDFSHVALIGTVPNAFFVAANVPAKNMNEFVSWIKTQNKAVPFGSGGGGSIGHIVGEMFKNELKLNMEHVAYKGSAPMFQDMLGGHLSIGVNTLPEVWELAKQEKLRVIALTAPSRAKIAPNIPTVVELNLPKLVAENFVGISGPAGMPAAQVTRLNAVMNELLSDPKLVTRLEEMGFTLQKMTPPAFTSFVQKQVTDFSSAVKASGAKLN
jgi:tripartite-type tricarboxylate transporter receptor subunit TctC